MAKVGPIAIEIATESPVDIATDSLIDDALGGINRALAYEMDSKAQRNLESARQKLRAAVALRSNHQ